MAEILHELILVISNKGYTHELMEVAKEHGARGGTVLHAKGTADAETTQFFGIKIQPEKEIILIVVPKELTKNIMKALSEEYGTHTKVSALSFSLPVTHLCGFVFDK